MTVTARWPDADLGAGMYESFYLRAVSPDEPVGVWVRYTVQKPPGREPRGSVWFTMFDPGNGQPAARKRNEESPALASPGEPWIRIGEAAFGPDRVEGAAGGASWDLRVTGAAPPLRHLARPRLYRTPVPKTKPESPAPSARFEGSVEIDGRRYELDGWPGMLGHNWGSEHAWTWIWLSGTAFAEDPHAWIDLALGRVKLAGRLTPWVGNGAITIGGERHRLGGMLRRGLNVEAEPGRTRIDIPGAGGVRVGLRASAPHDRSVAWRYGSPDGHVHDVVNSSIASLELEFTGERGAGRRLTTGHGGVYELGLPESQTWLEPQPIPDAW